MSHAEAPCRRPTRAGRIPARRDIAVSTLDDQQDLPISQLESLLVGTPDVRNHRQLVGALLQQDRVMRRDQSAVALAHQGAPGILTDQPSDDLRILGCVIAVVPHRPGFWHPRCPAAQSPAPRTTCPQRVGDARPGPADTTQPAGKGRRSPQPRASPPLTARVAGLPGDDRRGSSQVESRSSAHEPVGALQQERGRARSASA